MITALLVDEGTIEKYKVTPNEPLVPSKNFTACKTIGRYDVTSPMVVQLWNDKTLLINPARIIWTMHQAD